MPQIIDLSVAIENNEHTDHPGGSPKVTYRNHTETAGGLAHFFPGLQTEDLPDGLDLMSGEHGGRGVR